MSQNITSYTLNQPNIIHHQNQTNQQQYKRLPPNLIHIRADDNDKKIMITFWVIFISIFVFMAFMMLAIPKQLIQITNQQQLQGTSLQNCTNPIRFDNITHTFVCNNFTVQNPIAGLFVLGLRDLNQFLFLFLQIHLKNQSDTFSIAQKITVQQFSLMLQLGNGTPNWILDQSLYNSTYTVIIDPQTSTKIEAPEGNREGRNNQPKQKIYRKLLAYEYDTDSFQNQYVSVQFTLPNGLINVQNIQLIGVTINPQFSIFTILIRYFCLVGSLVSGIVYILRYKDVPLEYRTIQQRLVLVQTVLLWFFNDPLYPATILKPNGFLTFYSVFVVVNFVIFLIYSWMMFIDRILYENGKKETQLLNWKKFVYIGIIYILSQVLLCLVAFYHMEGRPIVSQYDVITRKFFIFSIITLVIILLGFIYIIVQYIRCCTDFYGKIWRNQLYLVFVVFFIILVGGLIIFDGFHIFNLVGRRILLIFTVMNVYTFYMQYMYSVTRIQIQRIRSGHIQIDNRRQIRSIMTEMNQKQIQLDMLSQQGLQNNLNNYGLKQSYLNYKGTNGDRKQLIQKDNELQQADGYLKNNKNRKNGNKKQLSSYQIQD